MKPIRIAILASLASILSVQSAFALTLEGAWQLAQQNDPALQAVREILPESQGEKLSVQAAFLPQLSGEARVRHYVKLQGWNMAPSPQFGTTTNIPFQMTDETVPTYAVGLEQMIFDSGRSIAQLQSARRNVDAARHSVFAQTQRRAVELVSVYNDFYLAKRQVEVAERTAHAWNEHERIARLRYQQKMVAYNDVLAAEVGAADARLKVREAKDREAVSAKRLAAIIGVMPSELSEPSVPTPPRSIPDAETRPEVQVKEAQAESAKLEARAEGLAYLPRFYGRAEVSYTDDSFLVNKDQYTFIGGVRVPLFDGARHWGQRSAAKARQARYRSEREALIDAYDVEREDVLKAWQRSDEEVRVARQNQARTAENLRIVRERYGNGMVPALDVREAIALWNDAAMRYHEARCMKQLTAARLRQVAGVGVLEREGEDAR